MPCAACIRLGTQVYRKYPKFVATLLGRADAYNKMAEDIQELEAKGEIFVIRPKTPLEIGRMSHDKEEILATYERGRIDGAACLDEMKQWLEG